MSMYQQPMMMPPGPYYPMAPAYPPSDRRTANIIVLGAILLAAFACPVDMPAMLAMKGAYALLGLAWPEPMGWQDFEMYWLSNGLRDDMPGVYMDQLIWYDSELQKDKYVKGAAIFAAGASGGWESYEILGRTAELLTQYLSVHPPLQ